MLELWSSGRLGLSHVAKSGENSVFSFEKISERCQKWVALYNPTFFFFKAIACLSFVLLLCFSLNSPLVICQIHMRVYKLTGHFVSLFASNYNQVSKHTFDKTERYVTIRANCKEILTKDIHAALKQFLTCWKFVRLTLPFARNHPNRTKIYTPVRSNIWTPY